MYKVVFSNKDNLNKYILGSFDNLKKLSKERKIFLITDKIFFDLYKKDLNPLNPFVIAGGEKSKSYYVLSSIFDSLLERGIKQSDLIVGIGGGVCTDISALAASMWKRGTSLGLIPTSLLAMVDASVGGKTAINYGSFKNLIGTFYMPEFILTDTNFLKTLPHQEYMNGMAEIIKIALVSDVDFFEEIENDFNITDSIIDKAVLLKNTIVQQDINDKGIRRKLNFGHTFGHAFEAANSILHGEAVSLGMRYSLKLSLKMETISEQEYERAIKIIDKLGFRKHIIPQIDVLKKALLQDKKRDKNGIQFIVLDGIGNAKEIEIDFNDLISLL